MYLRKMKRALGPITSIIIAILVVSILVAGFYASLTNFAIENNIKNNYTEKITKFQHSYNLTFINFFI